jgi:hypothetical protein
MRCREVFFCQALSALVLFATCLALLVIQASAALAADTAEQPKWELNDSWTYTNRSFITPLHPRLETTRVQLVVASVEGSEFYVLEYAGVDSEGKKTQARQRWSAATNFLNMASGGMWQEFQWYQWPLVEGRTWEYKWFAPAFGDTLTWSAKVRGWETIIVPAGTFRTIRIELENSCYWPGVDGGICRQEDVLWYSPQVKRHVRLERRSSKAAYVGNNILEELEAYHVK